MLTLFLVSVLGLLLLYLFNRGQSPRQQVAVPAYAYQVPVQPRRRRSSNAMVGLLSFAVLVFAGYFYLSRNIQVDLREKPTPVNAPSADTLPYSEEAVAIFR